MSGAEQPQNPVIPARPPPLNLGDVNGQQRQIVDDAKIDINAHQQNSVDATSGRIKLNDLNNSVQRG